jgi:hypothetical protein
VAVDGGDSSPVLLTGVEAGRRRGELVEVELRGDTRGELACARRRRACVGTAAALRMGASAGLCGCSAASLRGHGGGSEPAWAQRGRGKLGMGHGARAVCGGATAPREDKIGCDGPTPCGDTCWMVDPEDASDAILRGIASIFLFY